MKNLLSTDLAIRPAQLFWHRDLGQESLLGVCAKLGLVFKIMLMAPCWRMGCVMPLPQNTSRFSAYSGRRAQIGMTTKIIKQIFNF
jgi:hypothetical protein